MNNMAMTPHLSSYESISGIGNGLLKITNRTMSIPTTCYFLRVFI